VRAIAGPRPTAPSLIYVNDDTITVMQKPG